MSTLCPYRIIKGDDGLSVKVEWDVHYLTDEQIGTVRKYVTDIEAENAKLREELARWERLTAGINLPDYPVSQFVPKDLERENEKLRELVRDMWEFGFGCNSGANDAWAWHERTDELEGRMRELGVDFDG